MPSRATTASRAPLRITARPAAAPTATPADADPAAKPAKRGEPGKFGEPSAGAGDRAASAAACAGAWGCGRPIAASSSAAAGPLLSSRGNGVLGAESTGARRGNGPRFVTSTATEKARPS